MRSLKSLLPFLLLLVLPTPIHSQKRQPPKSPRKASAITVSQPITFDTLLASDRYKIYAEVRSVGQLVRSSSVSEILEPVLKLAGPPKEFKQLIGWVDAHADDVMTSRMLLATWPTAKNVPDVVFAIEFESSEEAARFLPQLNIFLPKVLPPSAPSPSASPTGETQSKPAAETDDSAIPKPSFFIKQAGSLLLISPAPINLKALRPSGSKLLTEQPSFRVARNRFTSEHVFVYVDINSVVKEDEERRRQYEEDEKKRAEEIANAPIKSDASPSPEQGENQAPLQGEKINARVELPTSEQSATPVPTPDPLATAVGMMVNSFFTGETNWPDAIGVGISFEHDSFDVRALMVATPGEKCDVLPFVPNLKPGPPIVPESPSILPADTELFATFSLDLPQITAAVNKAPSLENQGPQRMPVAEEFSFLPVPRLEGLLKININEELLPLLGPEVVISMPVRMLEDGPRRTMVVEDVKTNESGQLESKPPSGPPVVVALGLKDREGMKALLPRIVDTLGFKGASSFAQKEQREDTEIVSYAGIFSYAFIGNFLVLSADQAALRHVVDSYLKHETLSSDIQFRNYTRWQPRQLQAQVYVSPALMDSYKTWAEEPGALLSDQTKEFLSRLSVVPQPVTYSLSNDGLGTLHELHVPKNLVLMAIAGISADSNPSPLIANERATIGALYMIANVEAQYRSSEGQGSFATLEKLIENEMVSKEFLENHGYRIELAVTGSKFEVTATPLEYGKTGRMSYYIDDSNILRGADHAGGSASVADKPIR